MHQRAPFTQQKLNVKPLQDVAGLERWDKSRSARWSCRLKVITPLCVQSAFQQQYRAQLPPIIPGTSIRGMVRNAAEILGAGCGRFYAGGRELPPSLAACTTAAACVVCRSFGFVAGQETWQSKVRFSDAILPGRPDWTKVWQLLDVEGQRGYDGGEVEVADGWALFVHREDQWRPGRTPCARAGTEFEFGVEWQNLDAEELAVFRLALTLEHEGDRLVHKMGFAKALGLGSCRVRLVNEEPIKEATRRGDVEKEAGRYAAGPGYQAIKKWRTVEG